MTTTNFPGSGSGSHMGDTPYGSTTGQTSTKDQAGQAAGTAKDEGRHVAGVAQEEARAVASEARDQAYGLVGQATSHLEDQSRTQKDRLAETTRTFGQDLESMASNGEGLAADVARQVADHVKNLSSQLETREPADLLDEVRRFARRKPGTFLLGALAAGVVAGRLTRGAKDARESQGTATGTYGTSGAATYGTSTGTYGTAASGTGTATGTGPTYAGDVTSPGAPLSQGREAASSGPIDPTPGAVGTAAGDPLAGIDQPDEPVTDPQVETDTDPGATWTDPSQQGGRP